MLPNNSGCGPYKALPRGLQRVLEGLQRVLGVLQRVPGVLQRVLEVLQRVLGVLQRALEVLTIPAPRAPKIYSKNMEN